MTHELLRDSYADEKPVWGVKAIAAVIDRTPRQTYYLCERGLIPATKIGEQWTALPSRLRRIFNGEAA